MALLKLNNMFYYRNSNLLLFTFMGFLGFLENIFKHTPKEFFSELVIMKRTASSLDVETSAMCSVTEIPYKT
jgi:hypothetical protein